MKMVAIKDMEIKCLKCRKSTNVYASKLEGHYVCITCCCIFMPKKKRGNENG